MLIQSAKYLRDKINALIMQYQLPDEYEFLSFNRFDAYVKGQNITEQQIAEVQTELSKENTSNNETHILLNKQLGMYYAFYKRDLVKAYQHLSVWYASISDKQSIEFATACNYLGYAFAIDEKYAESTYFDEAAEIYKDKMKSEPEISDHALNYAFSLSFIALITRRQAGKIYENNPNVAQYMLQLALTSLLEAEGIQKNHNANVIDLATTYHLLAASEVSRKNHEQAETYISKSLEHWQEASSYFSVTNPLQFESEYLYVKIQMRLENYRLAARYAANCVQKQITIFGSENNQTVLDSLLLLGEVYEKNQQHTEALETLECCLQIMKVLKADNEALRIINNNIQRLVDIIHREVLEQQSELLEINSSFQLDLNDASSQVKSRFEFTKIQEAINKFQQVVQNLAPESSYALAQLKYKIAKFYLHLVYDKSNSERIDRVISYLNDAKAIITTGPEYFWVLNQLAYAYLQKLKSRDFSVLNKLYSVSMEVILHNELPAATKEQCLLVAFANSTTAQAMAMQENYDSAIYNTQKALKIYQNIGEEQDVQCFRTLCNYARYLTKNNQIELAEQAYATICGCLQKIPHLEWSEYAARYFLEYARFLRDYINLLPRALEHMQKAHGIFMASNNISHAEELKTEIQELRERCVQAPVKVSNGPSQFNNPPNMRNNNESNLQRLDLST